MDGYHLLLDAPRCFSAAERVGTQTHNRQLGSHEVKPLHYRGAVFLWPLPSFFSLYFHSPLPKKIIGP